MRLLKLFGGTSIRPFEAKPQIEVDEELGFHLEQRIRDSPPPRLGCTPCMASHPSIRWR
jgi:hypothetical protein